MLLGNRRVLITMATGTGKTMVAFQICWKLWNSRWTKSSGTILDGQRPGQRPSIKDDTSSRTNPYRKPRILFLADRNILVDDPKDKTFAPFGDARFKIENGKVSKSREIYFAIY